MNQDQTDYEEAVKFLELPRCIKCEHYNAVGVKASCSKHGEIPVDYLFTPTDCQDYELRLIPF